MAETKLTWTKAQLEDVIKNGGSVMHRGMLINRVDDIPTEAELRAAHEGEPAIEEIRSIGTGARTVANAPGDPTGDPHPISHGEENVDPETGATISSAGLAALDQVAKNVNKSAKGTTPQE